MNKIQAKHISSFNQETLNIFVDDQPLCDFLSAKTNSPDLEDLWCAWLMADSQQTWNYIWSLIENKQNCNLPVLLCPDDMDFCCTVVVAKVQYDNDLVVWERIGIVTGKFDTKQWIESGIKDISKWSEEDWRLYGGSLAWLDTYDKAWEEWQLTHWPDEERRRLWNYYHPYFNNDDNIQWLNCERLSFLAKEYNDCVAAFKQDSIDSK